MSDNPLFQQIQAEVDANPVLLFMKGSAMFPQCGFSAAVVQVLNHFGVKYKTVNILENDDMRQGLKEYSSWPTFPQLYVKGEFVGGCDIVREMAASGDLAKLFEEKGVEMGQ
ncbi:Grx4 family monothiol glutaredoxin [Novispirillum itersonii]|uniref:Glutaredoxin n=1 Tax=Novispirillum itersonii TaxID=189 RepID=A0A7W9ZEB8_NOVIT|nr:Grx4 family monothiol glutaredoxin [Novispirillum itersonii]MBB6209936.1 monothiol glutaredoxin [Novispirillum itersonii]